jgi:threonine dehydrogenase-like Zn-dependent dehydrogenase
MRVDVVAEVKRLTNGGADVAIEALGLQETFESALRAIRPGGTLSTLSMNPCGATPRRSPAPSPNGSLRDGELERARGWGEELAQAVAA